jgi:cAMP phosphodiesterase
MSLIHTSPDSVIPDSAKTIGSSPKTLDTLTKYVYRCMAEMPAQSVKTLRWHAACVAEGGEGTIARVMTSRFFA